MLLCLPGVLSTGRVVHLESRTPIYTSDHILCLIQRKPGESGAVPDSVRPLRHPAPSRESRSARNRARAANVPPGYMNTFGRTRLTGQDLGGDTATGNHGHLVGPRLGRRRHAAFGHGLHPVSASVLGTQRLLHCFSCDLTADAVGRPAVGSLQPGLLVLSRAGRPAQPT